MLKKILKNGALFFAVGVALALAAPPVATFLGAGILGEAALAHAVATPVLWTGAFFGMFGAIDTALRPMFDRLFGDKDAPAADTAKKAEAPQGARQVNITIVSPAQSIETHKYRTTIKAERVALEGVEKTPGAS